MLAVVLRARVVESIGGAEVGGGACDKAFNRVSVGLSPGRGREGGS